MMLTNRQIAKIKKSLELRRGTDLKISATQIRHSVKEGGSLFSSLVSLGSKLLPFAIRRAAKLALALATGAATALGETGIKKLLGNGITIPREYMVMLPPFAKEFTKSQRDQINKVYKTGGQLVAIKPTRKQIEGGFWGTLASIGIPMAISLVSKIFGGGLQVDRGNSSNTKGVYVPPPPPISTHGEGHIKFPPPFFGTWENPIGMGLPKGKKKIPEKDKRQGDSSWKQQSIQLNSHSRNNFLTPSFEIKPLSNFDLMDWVKKLGIKSFRGVYSRDTLPDKIRKECGIINLDDIQGPGTHWVCYRNGESASPRNPPAPSSQSTAWSDVVEYFDPFGLIMPNEALKYFRTAGKRIVYSMDEIQNRNTVLCGYWCLYYLLKRQRGRSILDVLHNPYFDDDNSDFIKAYFKHLS